jgi:hypothetical protein
MQDELKKDVSYATAKAVIGSVPVVGAAATELFGLLVTPPIEKRRKEWMIDVGTRLKNLEEKKEVNLTELQSSELFIDIVLNTTQLALKTSEAEKKQLFQNVIENAATNVLPSETEIQIFLNFIDSFTVWHIKLLILFNSPTEWLANNDKQLPNLMSGSLFSLIEVAYPELDSKKDLCNIIWDDLKRAGLHNSGGLAGMMTLNGITASRTTELGKRFLNFIQTP